MRIKTQSSTLLTSKNDHVLSNNIVIISTEWNADITDAIKTKCIEVLQTNNFKNIIELKVPGAIEIPFVIKQYWENKKLTSQHPDIFIAIGCVIKGDTPHFDYVCTMLCNSIASLNISIASPSIMGVLTVNDKQQAIERIKTTQHKGEEFALAAIKMLLLKTSLIS